MTTPKTTADAVADAQTAAHEADLQAELARTAAERAHELVEQRRRETTALAQRGTGTWAAEVHRTYSDPSTAADVARERLRTAVLADAGVNAAYLDLCRAEIAAVGNRRRYWRALSELHDILRNDGPDALAEAVGGDADAIRAAQASPVWYEPPQDRATLADTVQAVLDVELASYRQEAEQGAARADPEAADTPG